MCSCARVNHWSSLSLGGARVHQDAARPRQPSADPGESHSGLGVDDHLGDAVDALAQLLLELARELVGVGQRLLGTDQQRQEQDLAGVGREQPDALADRCRSACARAARSRAWCGCSTAASLRARSSGRSSGSRWVWTSATPGRARIACSTRSAISCAACRSRSAGNFRCSETLVDPACSKIVMSCASFTSGSDSAIASTRSRRSRPLSAGLDVHHHVAARQRPLERALDQIGGAVALDDRLSGRHADDHVGEVTPRRLAQAQPAQLDVAAERRDRVLGRRSAPRSGARSISTFAFSRDQPDRRREDDRRYEQRRQRVALPRGPRAPRAALPAPPASRPCRWRSATRSSAAPGCCSDAPRRIATLSAGRHRRPERPRSPQTDTSGSWVRCRPRTDG